MTNTTSPSLCNSFPFLCSPIGTLVVTIPILIMLHIAVLGICFRLGRQFRDATHRRSSWGPDEECARPERLESSNSRPTRTSTQALAATNPSVRMVDMHGAATRVTGSREEPPPEYIGHYGTPTPSAGPVSDSPAGPVGIASSPLQFPPKAYLPPQAHFRRGNGQLIRLNNWVQQRHDYNQHLDDVNAEIEERQAILMRLARTQNAAAGFASEPGSGSSSLSPSRSSSSASPPQSVVDLGFPVESSSSWTTPLPDPVPSVVDLGSSVESSSSGTTPLLDPVPSVVDLGSPVKSCSSGTIPSPHTVPLDKAIFVAPASRPIDGGRAEASHSGFSEYVWKVVLKEWNGREFSGNKLRSFFLCLLDAVAYVESVNWRMGHFNAV